MKWSGKIGNNVEASLRLDGILISKPTKKCRCGEEIDLSHVADDETGLKLTQALKNMEGKLDWDIRLNILNQKVVAGKISLDGFFKEQMKLLHQYNEKEWGAKDVSYSANAVCPKCLTFMGKISVMLRLVNEPEIMELTNVFRARVVDVGAASLTIEITGQEDKVNSLIGLLRPFGIEELARTGRVAMVRSGNGQVGTAAYAT